MDLKQSEFKLQNVTKENTKFISKIKKLEIENDKWRKQVETSINLVDNINLELSTHKNECTMNYRRLKRRLVIKSLWFRSQLIKLERLLDLCISMDNILRPDLTCSYCFELYSQPFILYPCAHHLCRACINKVTNNIQTETNNKIQIETQNIFIIYIHYYFLFFLYLFMLD
jgi:hypothetical protein